MIIYLPLKIIRSGLLINWFDYAVNSRDIISIQRLFNIIYAGKTLWSCDDTINIIRHSLLFMHVLNRICSIYSVRVILLILDLMIKTWWLCLYVTLINKYMYVLFIHTYQNFDVYAFTGQNMWRPHYRWRL